MGIEEAFNAFESYNLWLIIGGIALLATSVLPRILAAYPFSMPMALLMLGYGVVALPLGLDGFNPLLQGHLTERVTELAVIIALMGSGLKIDRPFSWKGWDVTWRLLGLTMTASIALTSWVGWGIAGFVPATAVLLGAVIAPTDPVLASEVQVAEPGEESEDELRFALTSEAGLNDGLAFPFTYMAIAMALAGSNPANWIGTWLLIDVLYKIVVGVVFGLLLGRLLARVIFAMPSETHLAKSMIGLGTLAIVLLIYGITEYVSGYGFIATFVGAVAIRSYERHHEYHRMLHMFIENAERLLSAVILIALGGAVAGGLLEPLTWPLIISAVLIVLVIRPVTGIVGLIGFNCIPWRERWGISFFGIRGIGSFYYLAFALNQGYFYEHAELWALVALVVLMSVFIHGILAAPVTRKLDELRTRV